jgi:hypothetical protein
MKVVWVVHNYPPVCLGGAEFAAHRINTLLLKHGFKVIVYVISREVYPSEFEGVPIVCTLNPYNIVVDSDSILVSQLWAARVAHTLFEMKKPHHYIEFIHYVDSTVLFPYPWTTRTNITYVFNSSDTQQRALKIAPWLASVTTHRIRPLVFGKGEIRTNIDKYPWITLINFSSDKGAHVFNSLAEKDIHHKYVSVCGSHGDQVKPSEHVALLPCTLDMESIYENTRILLVPSTYETWCMVASEANARGIPVIACDTIPALQENCGDAALYVRRSDVDAWIAAITTIESGYAAFSTQATKRCYTSEGSILELFSGEKN